MINSILSIGLILIFGLLAGKLIHKIKVPSITAYLIAGIIVGPFFLNLVSGRILQNSGLISNIALGFIAFSLGQHFSIAQFKKIGKSVLYISIAKVLSIWILVTLAIWLLLKQPFYIALTLGAIASPAAPAAIMMVIREFKAKGTFTDTLIGVVAIDDAWGLIIFAFSFAVAKSLFIHTVDSGILASMIGASSEIIWALILGGVTAFILSRLSRYASNHTELLIYTLGFIMLNTGLAIHFDISVLLSNMVFGALLINIDRKNYMFFDALRSVDSPLYLVFFVLAGASLELSKLAHMGLLVFVYTVVRFPAAMLGASAGAYLAKAGSRITKYIGWGLAPQAGVALGMALIVKNSFGSAGGLIFDTIVVTTIIYELIGPLCTKFALSRAGEI